jgi:hypothetical protein
MERCHPQVGAGGEAKNRLAIDYVHVQEALCYNS